MHNEIIQQQTKDFEIWHHLTDYWQLLVAFCHKPTNYVVNFKSHDVFPLKY